MAALLGGPGPSVARLESLLGCLDHLLKLRCHGLDFLLRLPRSISIA
jgi:hypothetical protein